MHTRDIPPLMKAVAEVVREHVTGAFGVLKARIEAAEKRIAEVPVGPRGEKGERGESGEVGPVGSLGEKGERGESVAGPIGPAGEKGDSVVGERGEKGDSGDLGLRGPAGIQGERGIGETGPIGKDGRDAYQLALDEGYVGTRHQWLDSFIGKNGETGRDGRDAAPAINGKDGEHGRDALQIDVLDSLDLTRSYPRGTFAKHDGGIVRAARLTDPTDASPTALALAGWQVIIDGIKSIEVTLRDDERTFAVTSTFTSGRVIEKDLTLPVVIYRQVWAEGTQYQRGDQTTWDGSTWHCQTATTAKPGTSPDWRLCAKKGRDGKDGIGIKGDPGPPGKPGRDAGR